MSVKEQTTAPGASALFTASVTECPPTGGYSSRRRRQRDALQLVHRQQLDRRQPDPYQGLQDLAAPALAFHEGKLHLLLAGTDRRLWHTAYYNGAWGPATALTFKFGGAKRRHALRVRGINGPP